nr:MAG TPA: hypothetical protein [Caudoviricetes sp.]
MCGFYYEKKSFSSLDALRPPRLKPATPLETNSAIINSFLVYVTSVCS